MDGARAGADREATEVMAACPDSPLVDEPEGTTQCEEDWLQQVQETAFNIRLTLAGVNLQETLIFHHFKIDIG